MEETLIILKPDCMAGKLAGEVITLRASRFFNYCRESDITDSAILREHYAHVADKPFFPEIEAFMSSHAVMPMVLGGTMQRVFASF